MVWRWDGADPFGATTPDPNPAGIGQFVYNPRFPGQLYDFETGLAYNINRNYDPTLGRYVQSDPIGLRAGPNTYAYVRLNPLTNWDASGTYDCNGYWSVFHSEIGLGLPSLRGCTCWWYCNSCDGTGIKPMPEDYIGLPKTEGQPTFNGSIPAVNTDESKAGPESESGKRPKTRGNRGMPGSVAGGGDIGQGNDCNCPYPPGSESGCPSCDINGNIGQSSRTQDRWYLPNPFSIK
jgi:RHS repeat-associated protein